LSVTLRVLQQFDSGRETEFLRLEQEFAKLEARRPDYPKSKRMRPISSGDPLNTVVWECEFQDAQAARDILDFFRFDAEHEALYEKQSPYFGEVKIELYQNLEF
jgi:hypothetical protein